MKGRCLVTAFCLGLSSAAVQLIFVREFLNIFSGNELVLGLILGNWLLLGGAGAVFAYRLFRRNEAKAAAFIILSFLPFLESFGIRLLKIMYSAGEARGLEDALFTSLAILAPYCLLSAALLVSLASDESENSPARVYAADVFGAFAGGLLFTFLFAPLLSHFGILAVIGALSSIAGTAYIDGRRRKAAAVLLGTTMCCLFLFRDALEKKAAALMHPNQEILRVTNSVYGQLVTARQNEQVCVYANGVPTAASGEAAEETVHYALSQRPDARRVLLIGGGLSGSIAELLKYHQAAIDYVEPDHALLALVKEMRPETKTTRVTLLAADGRQIVARATDAYDVILLSLPEPASAALNRYFTTEFFISAKRALKKDGVLGFALPGGENYLSPEARQLSASVMRSLKIVFPHYLLIPGSLQHWAASKGALSYNIGENLERAAVPVKFLHRGYLQAKLDPERIKTVEAALSDPAIENRDLMPIVYLSTLRLWLAKNQSQFYLPLFFAGGLLFVSLLLCAKSPHQRLSTAVWSSGFAGLSIEIALTIAFQVYHGSLFDDLGLLVASFMLGSAAGASIKFKDERRTVCGIDLLLAAGAAVSAFIVSAPAAYSWFPALNFLAGALVGAQFAAASRICKGSQTASLFAVDFLGAALGAFVAASFCVPLLGVARTLLLISGLKTVSFVFLLLPAGVAVLARGIEAAVILSLPLIGIYISNEKINRVLSDFSFSPSFYWLLLALLWVGIISALKIPRIRKSWSLAPKVDRRLGMSVYRLSCYLGFALAAFYPLFRCYFLVPYIFCHLCPRKCIFGFLRPYVLPGALIMNLDKLSWCHNACPLGTYHCCQHNIRETRQLPRILKHVPLAVAAVVCFLYFFISPQKPSSPGGKLYYLFFTNEYAPNTIVILCCAVFVLLGFFYRRTFCRLLCPVGACSDLFNKIKFSGELETRIDENKADAR